jgi:hypothetical protein
MSTHNRNQTGQSLAWIDPYTVRSKRVAEFGQKLAAFDGAPSLPAFASLLWTALRC